MKIRIAYTADEQDKKQRIEDAVKRLFPDTKVKETSEKDGFLHTYLSVKMPKNPTK